MKEIKDGISAIFWMVLFAGVIAVLVTIFDKIFTSIGINMNEIGGCIAYPVSILIAIILLGTIIQKLDNKKKTNNLSMLYPENWYEIRALALERDNYQCGNCHASAVHVHHIVPLSKGGTNDLSNLRSLCEDCHKKIHPHMN
jgi:hypothetical protein